MGRHRGTGLSDGRADDSGRGQGPERLGPLGVDGWRQGYATFDLGRRARAGAASRKIDRLGTRVDGLLDLLLALTIGACVGELLAVALFVALALWG